MTITDLATQVATEQTPSTVTDIHTLLHVVKREREQLTNDALKVKDALDAGWVQSQHVAALAEIGAVQFDLQRVETAVGRYESGEWDADKLVQVLTKETFKKLSDISFAGGSTSGAANLIKAEEGTFWQRIARALEFCV